LTVDGVVAVIADQSAPMTSDEWARRAVELAVATGASEIAVEAFSARETYVRVVREALSRLRIERPIKVTGWPPKGSGRGGGDAVARSSALLQALEVGTVRIAGHLPSFEERAVEWQAGQHQPDSLAALVVAHDVLAHAASQRWSFATPIPGARFVERLGGESEPRRPRDSAVVVPFDSPMRRRIDGNGYDPLRGTVMERR
jgi:hypothetical protein